MVLKCGKTGRLFFSAQEAQDYAEAFGAAYANFDEVSPDTKCWICVETQRPCYTEKEMENYKRRDPEAKTFEEKTIQYLIDKQKEKDKKNATKNKFLDSVNQTKLQTLSEIKGHGQVRAAKALHFTGNKSVKDAEAWIEANKDDPDIDKLTDEMCEEFVGKADVDMSEPMEVDEPDERKPGDPNPPEVKEKINQDLLKQVMEMGFDEMKAEKALFITDNQGVEFAVNWLGEHSEDADFELPLKKPKPAPPPPPEKPKMSPEEAAAKAAELQKQIRERKEAAAKVDEKEKEKNRILSTKAMQETQAKLEEEEKKRAREQMKREEEEHAAHAAQLKEQLRLDYIERFGCEPPEEDAQAKVKEKPKKDQVAFFLNKMKKDHKDTNKDGLKTCLTTLKLYIKNLQENPQEPKFKIIKVENKAFQSRVAPIEGTLDLLDILGFENKGDVLEQRKSVPDGFLCGVAIKFIDLILGQL